MWNINNCFIVYFTSQLFLFCFLHLDFAISFSSEKSKKKDNTQPVCYELSESETVSTNEMFQFAVSFYVDS